MRSTEDTESILTYKHIYRLRSIKIIENTGFLKLKRKYLGKFS